MPQPRVLTVQDYVTMLRRRWYLVVFPTVVGLALGYGLVRYLPKRYTSKALMLVEQQQVPHNYVEPINTESLNARIANIEEQTLSRTRLVPIIQRYSLFMKHGVQPPMDQMVALMQKAIAITPVKPMVNTQEQTIPGFYLSVTLDNPRTAQEVCSTLASMFINEDLSEQEQSAEGTTNFLESQLEGAKQKLNQQDSILAAFEQKYMGSLPDETKTNLVMLGTLNTQLQAVTENLNRATQDQAYMQSVLAQQLQVWRMTQNMQAGYLPEQNTNPLLTQLANLKAQLANLKARYTDQYPDLIKVKQEIADTEKQIAASQPPANSKTAKGKVSAASLEPPQIQRLRGQLHSMTEAIKFDRQQQQQLKTEITVYESRLQLSPAVEEDYKRITRDHAMALKFYNSLLGKKEDSEMASQLEQRQEGEQLQLMDPASLPDEPSFPKPNKFIGGGLAAGLALGLIGVFVTETNDKRIRTGRDVQYYLGAPVFATIPILEITGISSSRRPKAAKRTKARKLIGG